MVRRAGGRAGAAGAVVVVLLAGGTAACGPPAEDGTGPGAAASRAASDPPPLALDRPGWTGDPHTGPVPPRRYVADGALPDGPDSAPVWRPRSGLTARDVTRIAEALDVPGTPELRGGNWRVGGTKDGTGPTLTVGAGSGTWTLSRYAPSGDDLCADGKPSRVPVPRVCPPEEEPGPDGWTPAPSPDGSEVGPPSEAEAERAVRPALKALGLEGADPEPLGVDGATRDLVVEPEVGGLPTSGWHSRFTVGPDGSLVRGHGHLGLLVKGAVYPVAGGEDTLEELNRAQAGPGSPASRTLVPDPSVSTRPMPRRTVPGQPEPEPSLPGPEDPEPSGLPKLPRSTPTQPGERPDEPRGPVAEVTGARFGLSARTSGGEQILVPSWIFEVRRPFGENGTYRLTYPAVAPDHLRLPAREPSPPVDRLDRSDRPEQEATSYSVDGRTLRLHFWGGVCHPYTARAEETDAEVSVTIRAEDVDPEEVCVMVAKRQTVEVGLDAPLGDRAVVDGGERVPRR